MEIFNAHPITREYLGPSHADPDPLEEGGWLVPAHAYTDAPPLAPLGKAIRRRVTGEAWEVVADYRGTVYSITTGQAQQYVELGELPDGLTAIERPSPDHSWRGGEWVFDEELQASNRLALLGSLCQCIDTAADAARSAVAGDPLRAVEYDRARAEAQSFVDANYQGEVPAMVAAWAISGRSAREAADDILREAGKYTAALITLRATRLAAKEQVRLLMTAGEVEQAKQLVDYTVESIQAAVGGIGNAGA